MNLEGNADWLVIVAKGFLKLPNFFFPRSMILTTFEELKIMLSTKVNLLYLFCLTELRCCLLLLIKQLAVCKKLL